MTDKAKTAKEFDREYWQKNNPITTPLWKCMKAYADYREAYAKSNPKLSPEITDSELIDKASVYLEDCGFNGAIMIDFEDGGVYMHDILAGFAKKMRDTLNDE